MTVFFCAFIFQLAYGYPPNIRKIKKYESFSSYRLLLIEKFIFLTPYIFANVFLYSVHNTFRGMLVTC